MFTSLCKTALTVAFGATLVAPLSATRAQAGPDPFLGEIMMVGYTFCPRGWLDAAGQLLPISANTALFSLYGTTYGGDGRTTFALPDLRGRVAMSTGAGPGLSNRPLGQTSGAEAVTVSVPQMPAHNHGVAVTLNASPAPGSSPSPAGQLNALTTGGTPYGTTGAAPMAPNAASVTQQNVGGGQAVPNMQPSIVLRYCVATQGVFPSRN